MGELPIAVCPGLSERNSVDWFENGLMSGRGVVPDSIEGKPILALITPERLQLSIPVIG